MGKPNKKTKKAVATQEVVVPVARTEPKAPAWTISIKLGPDTLIGIGRTCLEALQAIEKPKKIVSKSFITIEHNNKKTERYFKPVQLHRLFYTSQSLQEIQAKMLSVGLK